jgi:CRISPR/Cas system CSM-associated protein Csm3 (group 7 of RAMP superfamily)
MSQNSSTEQSRQVPRPALSVAGESTALAYGWWHGNHSRRIRKRIVVEGALVLQTPTRFGNGDSTDQTDMPLLAAPHDGRTPLLTGATLAGALRSYLLARAGRADASDNGGDTGRATPNSIADVEAVSEGGPVEVLRDRAVTRLFGADRMDENGEQSNLIVDDSYGALGTEKIELREGVRLQPQSRTAREKALFNFTLWPAGTRFPLRFETVIRDDDDEDALKRDLASTLTGLSDGGITLGGRKRRGYGEVKVESWNVREYDLTDLTRFGDLFAWIESGETEATQGATTEGKTEGGTDPREKVGADLAALLGVKGWPDARRWFRLCGSFELDGSLLIRSGSGEVGPDDVHLRSYRPGGEEGSRAKPILSGTSLAGALRARAFKIVHTLAGIERASVLTEALFGSEMGEGNRKPKGASRLTVKERILEGSVREDLVQNRVSIDRFTGGARETALFNVQPVFGRGGSQVTVEMRLANPESHEIGLLLLLLKDLWTSDLPLGGESSVGRGRLKGVSARLEWKEGEDLKAEEIRRDDRPDAPEHSVEVPDDLRGRMEASVKAFHDWIQRKEGE